MLPRRGWRLTDRVVCYGDVIDDIVVTPQGPIQPDTDTRSAIQVRPGGSAANTAAWLATAGCPVSFVGVVGLGDADRHANALPGVESRLREHPVLQTGRIVIIVQQDRRDMLTDRGANTALSPDDVTDDLLARARVLHLTGHVLLNDAGFDGARRLIDRCRTAGVLLSISPGSAGLLAELDVRRVCELLAAADFVFANHGEGVLLTGIENSESIALELASSTSVAVVTAGPAGFTVARNDRVFSETVRAAPVVDPTGAGDAFCAGFLSAWLRTQDDRIAARAGAGLAATAVGIVGGRPATTSLRG